MNTTYCIASSFVLCLLVIAGATAQEATEEGATGKTDNVIAETQAKVDDIAEQIDENEKAKEVSAGILQPIYALAEYLSFPAVHWVAFTIMATGVVTFALQLVLGKLVVLLKAGFSFTEILSDTLGLAISTVGLVLTTQAAAENSNFTQSPAAVLSASGVGVVLGFIFYLWGQSQEIQALRGRRTNAAKS
jgi:ABC-type multidrug transport system fused ATPase/permease subunit